MPFSRDPARLVVDFSSDRLEVQNPARTSGDLHPEHALGAAVGLVPGQVDQVFREAKMEADK